MDEYLFGIQIGIVISDLEIESQCSHQRAHVHLIAAKQLHQTNSQTKQSTSFCTKKKNYIILVNKIILQKKRLIFTHYEQSFVYILLQLGKRKNPSSKFPFLVRDVAQAVVHRTLGLPLRIKLSRIINYVYVHDKTSTFF